VKPCGGSAKVELFGDGDEVSQVAEFHTTKVSPLINDVLDCRFRIPFISGDHTTQEKKRGRMSTLGKTPGGHA
jgi:hypothetical protein